MSALFRVHLIVTSIAQALKVRIYVGKFWVFIYMFDVMNRDCFSLSSILSTFNTHILVPP